MKRLITLSLVGALMIALGYSQKTVKRSGSENTVNSWRIDSIPPKQYIYVIKVSPQEWQRSMDTVSGVIDNIGRTLTVDNATFYKEAIIRQILRLQSKIVLDSIVTKK